MISSETLEFEIRRIPHLARKKYALEAMAKAVECIRIEDLIEAQAAAFIEKGMKPLDALHLACAESANATYFCTCDDKFLKKAKAVEGLVTCVVSPLELVEELEI